VGQIADRSGPGVRRRVLIFQREIPTMKFLSRVFGASKTVSQTRQTSRSPRRRAQFGLEALEGRELKTVSLVGGQIDIQTDQYSGNTTEISYQDNQVRVDYDGQSYTFAADQVSSISYMGGYGGGDKLANHTGLTMTSIGFGGDNHFSASGGFNYCYLIGGNNSFDSGGGGTYLFTYGGYNNSIAQYGNTCVFAY
jgi:hypothetical protein